MYRRLNYLRFFLALTVLMFHANILAVPLGGTLAVWCFFVISGYLISDILYGRYQGRPYEFLLNRFLRIYPIYWTALAMGLAILLLLPESELSSFEKIFHPRSYEQWFWNISLFGAGSSSGMQWVVQPAWSLAVEVRWYVILFLGGFLPRRLLIPTLTALLIAPVILHFNFNESILIKGAGYCFALGALAFHLRTSAPRIVQLGSLALLPVLLFAVPLYFGLSVFETTTGVWLTYMAVPLLLCVAMPWLAVKSPASKLSQLAGDLSYPLFLIHCYVIFALKAYFDMPQAGWDLVIATIAISVPLSCLMLFVVDRPIAHIRSVIRYRGVDSQRTSTFEEGAKNQHKYKVMKIL